MRALNCSILLPAATCNVSREPRSSPEARKIGAPSFNSARRNSVLMVMGQLQHEATRHIFAEVKDPHQRALGGTPYCPPRWARAHIACNCLFCPKRTA